MKRLIVVFFTLVLPFSVFADDPQPPPATEFNSVPEPPDIPTIVKSGEVLEPDIRIIESGTQRVEEYSANGQVYLVKITPKGGFPPYYLVDSDGDGSLDLKSAYYNTFQIPQWVLFSW